MARARAKAGAGLGAGAGAKVSIVTLEPPQSGAHFEYYDSCSGANAEAAQAMSHCFGRLLSDGDGARTSPPFRTMDTPQQTNGHDCGLYLLRIAQVLCAEACEVAGGGLLRVSTRPPPALLSLTPANINKVRAQLLGLVEAYTTPSPHAGAP